MFILFYTPTPMLGAVFGILLSVTPSASIFRLWSYLVDMNSFRLDDQINSTEPGSSFFFTPTSHHHRIHHTAWDDLNEVIPWMLSLLVFVIIPVIMKVIEAVRYDGLDRQSYDRRKRSIARVVIEKCLRMCRKVVRKEDLTSNRTNEVIKESTILSVPKPGTIWDDSESEYSDKEVRRAFVGSCAVCLSSYRAGDMIVWSSNSQCQHVFHESCFITWAQVQECPTCPCCRQSFVKRELSDQVLPTVNDDEVYYSSSE